MSLTRVAIPSPNYSTRNPAGVRLLVLHTAEGSRTYQSLGSYMANPAAQVSSHAGIDDTPGTIGVYVRRADNAWTQAGANAVSVSAELCGFAAWDSAEWHRHSHMLENCAAWLAEEAAAHNLPLTALTAAAAQGSGRGVCQHIDLGAWGGGHVDCGAAFPLGEVLAMAGGAPPATAPPKPSTPPAGPKAGPPFPYPAGHYLGQPSPDPNCHSGYYGGVDTGNVRTWQARMAERGWALGVDGKYGPQSETVCRQFQTEKGLAVDGLVGPNTWAAAWSAPIT